MSDEKKSIGGSSGSSTHVGEDDRHHAVVAQQPQETNQNTDDIDKTDLEKAVQPNLNDEDTADKPLSPMDPRSFPDGGLQAWLVVSGAFCCLFCSFGWINAIGVFQTYYEQNQLKAYSPSTIAWISSLETFMMFGGGPVIGKLYDNHGPRWLLLIGSFFTVFGLMMTSIW